MSATGRAPEDPAADAAATEADEDSAAAHRYFRALEDVFIRLRGAPLLLSPADHLLARTWFREGIPLEVVTEALEGLFERRRERGSTNRVSSLRYCRPAVEKEWKRYQELRTAARRTPAAPTLDLADRLWQLAESLPADLPERTAWTHRITALEGKPEAVEDQLLALDRELLEALTESLAKADRADLDTQVDSALAGVALRLPSDELEAARHRLLRQMLRQRFEVPLLTLFDG
jgi:hypothetical protein